MHWPRGAKVKQRSRSYTCAAFCQLCVINEYCMSMGLHVARSASSVLVGRCCSRSQWRVRRAWKVVQRPRCYSTSSSCHLSCDVNISRCTHAYVACQHCSLYHRPMQLEPSWHLSVTRTLIYSVVVELREFLDTAVALTSTNQLTTSPMMKLFCSALRRELVNTD